MIYVSAFLALSTSHITAGDNALLKKQLTTGDGYVHGLPFLVDAREQGFLVQTINQEDLDHAELQALIDAGYSLAFVDLIRLVATNEHRIPDVPSDGPLPQLHPTILGLLLDVDAPVSNDLPVFSW